MEIMRKMNVLLMVVLFGIGCSTNDLGPVKVDANYSEGVEAFFETRSESLSAPTGWLRLNGMFWFEEGRNTFGSGKDRDIIFPEGSIPSNAGYFELKDGIVTVQVQRGVDLKIDGETITNAVIFDQANDIAPNLTHADLEWFIIRRDSLIGVRLYNKANENADTFEGFDRFTVNTDFYVHGRLVPHAEPTTIRVVNVLGQEDDVASPGVVEFEIRGEKYSLVALQGTNRMFMIFGDPTNRTETYQAGRYMYIDYPEEGDDATILDFNRSYNPPCAFSQFTTCQLPPRQNILRLPIEAGEKRPGPGYQAVSINF